jgi:hypothetical protein
MQRNFSIGVKIRETISMEDLEIKIYNEESN